MPVRVVDASVVAALIFDEPRAEEADALMSDAELHVPRLLSYELANTALKKARRDRSLADLIYQGLERAFVMGIRLVDVPTLPVYRLAIETSLTAYDASYLYLARLLEAELVTFDQRLQAAAAGM